MDPFCALALALNASLRQAMFLKDFMYNYLASDYSIGVNVYVDFITPTFYY